MNNMLTGEDSANAMNHAESRKNKKYDALYAEYCTGNKKLDK